MGHSAEQAIVILGPTASGKTRLAANAAAQLGGEVLSIDSRQVYRGMDIGTGKDLGDLVVDGKAIPIHLTDIAEPGERISLFSFLQHFDHALADVRERGKPPVLCGGTGLYLDAILRGYRLAEVPRNEDLRLRLAGLGMTELTATLQDLSEIHNTTDTLDRDRLLRAIEIRTYEKAHPEKGLRSPLQATVIGTQPERSVLRERITRRLDDRLGQGLVEEVSSLAARGLSLEDMEYYGLEYRYVGRYLAGKLSFDEMRSQLNTAIHQFAKRQVTWFRRMERNGVQIHWIDTEKNPDQQLINLIDTI